MFLFNPGRNEAPGEVRFSTSIGGPGTFNFNERVNAVLEDSPGLVLFAGETGSFQVPTSEGALQPEYAGGPTDIVIGRMVVDALKEPSTVKFLRGDCTADGGVDVSDAVCVLDRLFRGARVPRCGAEHERGRADRLGRPRVRAQLLFGGGETPVAPFPDCGPGTLPSDAELGCANPPPCQ